MSIKIMLIVFISTVFHKILTTAVAYAVYKKNRRYQILEKSLLFSTVQIKAESLKAISSFITYVLIIANVFHKRKEKIPV